MQNLSPIIEVDELMQISENQNLRIFDVRTGSNAKENYNKKHLEYSVFVDLNSDLAEIDDPKNGGRHPLPKFEDFIKILGELGIDKNFDRTRRAFNASQRTLADYHAHVIR